MLNLPTELIAVIIDLLRPIPSSIPRKDFSNHAESNRNLYHLALVHHSLAERCFVRTLEESFECREYGTTIERLRFGRTTHQRTPYAMTHQLSHLLPALKEVWMTHVFLHSGLSHLKPRILHLNECHGGFGTAGLASRLEKLQLIDSSVLFKVHFPRLTHVSIDGDSHYHSLSQESATLRYLALNISASDVSHLFPANQDPGTTSRLPAHNTIKRASVHALLDLDLDYLLHEPLVDLRWCLDACIFAERATDEIRNLSTLVSGLATLRRVVIEDAHTLEQKSEIRWAPAKEMMDLLRGICRSKGVELIECDTSDENDEFIEVWDDEGMLW